MRQKYQDQNQRACLADNIDKLQQNTDHKPKQTPDQLPAPMTSPFNNGFGLVYIGAQMLF